MVNKHINLFNDYISELPIGDEAKKVLLEKNEQKQNPLFYLEYASLFQSSFDFPDKKSKIKHLNIAGYLCYKYALVSDTILDTKSSEYSLKIFNIYLEEYIKILASIFKLDSPFWSYYNLRKKEFFDAAKSSFDLFQETNIKTEIYENLCDSKSALGKLAIDALCVLNSKDGSELHKKILLSHKYFSIGFQISDDIMDIKEDFKNKQFNYGISTYYSKYRKEDDIETLNKLFYINGVATDLYHKAIFYFEKSLNIALELNLIEWQKVIKHRIQEMHDAIKNYNDYISFVKIKTKLKTQSKKIHTFDYTFRDNAIERGLRYIVKDWEKGLPEIKHLMILSQNEGFENKKNIHIGDIFQRAILADNLIELNKHVDIDLSSIVDCELKYLLEQRNSIKHGGGWSYFPTVKEIAADADDLGQILQLFQKMDFQVEITKYCLPLINILIHDCRNIKTGGIETWIIPSENRTKRQVLQDKFNVEKWGKGPDVDVMANFLYGLALYNYDKFSDIIVSGLIYIIKNIEENYWNARWYVGWLYPTMVCSRLLALVLKKDLKINRQYQDLAFDIQKRIIKEQNKDGGWAYNFNDSSDPLNTAFAIECLNKLDFELTSKECNEAINYLKNNQQDNGSWEAVPFITPRVGSIYKSEVLTTSYALKVISTYGKY